MPKYKVGDVAALFPDPPKPKTESGKKIQALFNDFYNKPSKPSKKWKNQNLSEGKEKEVEDKTKSIAEKEPKKKKRKFQNSNISDPAEVTDVQVDKKPKLESAVATAPFPRSKSRKDRNSNGGSYLPKKVAKEEDFGEESFSPKTKDEDSFPRKKAQKLTLEQEIPSHPKKKKKKRASQNDSTAPDKESESIPPTEESESNPKESQPEKMNGKKKKGKKKAPKDDSNAADEGLPDFLKLKSQETEESSKVVFRMKKQREIPSCKEIFGKREKNDELADGVKGPVVHKAPRMFARERVEETEERLSRTLFVGNLPISTTKKSLEKLFSPFGSLESCRLRGAVPTKSTIPRKIAEIKQKYHSGLQSRIAYVVLKDRKSALAALSLSGMSVDGHHIVVDRASASGEKKLYDEKRSVFVGNLPFAITDETLWSSFLPCGDIEAVRVIRDKETGAGKGFGYISFQKLQGKEKALALPSLEIDGRQLRIRSVEGGKKKIPQAPSPWKSAMKRIAKKNKKDGNTNSRKTLKKLVNRGKLQHQKKKVAGIFKKFSKD